MYIYSTVINIIIIIPYNLMLSHNDIIINFDILINCHVIILFKYKVLEIKLYDSTCDWWYMHFTVTGPYVSNCDRVHTPCHGSTDELF